MGDARFVEPLLHVRDAADRAGAIRDLTYDELILALGAASREGDPYLANVLTTALLNRSRRGAALVFSAGMGVAAGIVLLFIGAALLSRHPHNFDDHVFLILTFVALAAGAVGASLVHSSVFRHLTRRRA